MSSSVSALQVSPSVPAAIEQVEDLRGENSGSAGILRSASSSAGSIPELWRKVEGSPRLFLRSVDQSILDHAAADPSFIEEYRDIVAEFDDTSAARRRRRRGSSVPTSSRISAPSTDFTRASRSTRVAWESLPATIARRPAISAAVRRGRAAVPAGLLQSANRSQRPAGPRVLVHRSAQRAAVDRARTATAQKCE